jgi:predicted DNA-binding transcriptional regulator AlpA
VGSAEVASLLGISRQRLAQIVAEKDDFPQPEAVLSSGRIWLREAIEGWAARNPGRRQRWPTARPAPGEWSPDVRRVIDLAVSEARGMNHAWVGVDHLVLALLRDDCPGAAGIALRSFGLEHDDLRAAWSDSMGDPFDTPPRAIAMPPAAQVLLERANLKAAELEDGQATSEHVLLAVADTWGDSWMTADLRRRGIDADDLRERVMLAREEDMPAANGSTLELAKSPAGHDPWKRVPWGSAVFHVDGRPVTMGNALLQYCIDRDGFPVLTTDGGPVHLKVDAAGKLVLDATGHPILDRVEIPPGSGVQQQRSSV